MAVDTFSFLSLIVLAFGGLLVVGVLAAIVALLVNPKTRVVGVVLLAIVVLGVALIGGAAFLYLFLDAPTPVQVLQGHVGPLLHQTG